MIKLLMETSLLGLITQKDRENKLAEIKLNIPGKELFAKKQSESFYLNNSKLKKKINFKISIKDLKKECFRLSKKLFN